MAFCTIRSNVPTPTRSSHNIQCRVLLIANHGYEDHCEVGLVIIKATKFAAAKLARLQQRGCALMHISIDCMAVLKPSSLVPKSTCDR